jgi:hypothetical protein
MTSELTPEVIAELRELLAKSTPVAPGNWRYRDFEDEKHLKYLSVEMSKRRLANDL